MQMNHLFARGKDQICPAEQVFKVSYFRDDKRNKMISRKNVALQRKVNQSYLVIIWPFSQIKFFISIEQTCENS